MLAGRNSRGPASRSALPCSPVTLELVKPALPYLPEYRAALETGWSADNVRGADAAREELAKIVADPLHSQEFKQEIGLDHYEGRG